MFQQYKIFSNLKIWRFFNNQLQYKTHSLAKKAIIHFQFKIYISAVEDKYLKRTSNCQYIYIRKDWGCNILPYI